MGFIRLIRPVSPIPNSAPKYQNRDCVKCPDAVQARKEAREKRISGALIDLLRIVINVARMVWPGSFDIIIVDQALLGDGRKKVGCGDHRAEGERAADNQKSPPPL